MASKARESVIGKTRTRAGIVFLLPAVLAAAFLCLKLVSPRTYVVVVQEDNVVEYLQGLFYLIAAVFAFITAIRLLRTGVTITTLLYVLFALALLLTCLEEISWGQRIFGIGSTDFFLQHNDQEEINLHNLDPIKPFLHSLYILAGCYGAFAWLLVPRKITRHNKLSHLLLPPPILIFYFLPVAVFYAYWELGTHVLGAFFSYEEYTFGRWMDIQDQEVPELILALGLFFFAMINCRKAASSNNLTDRKPGKAHGRKARTPQVVHRK